MLELAVNGIAVQTAIHTPLIAQDFMEWSPLEVTCVPVPTAQSAHLTIGGEQLGSPTTSPFDPLWRWRWTPRGVVGEVHGEVRVALADGSEDRAMFALLLQPRLIDQHTWTALLDDIERLARGLAVTLGGATFAHATLVPLRDVEHSPLHDAYALLEHHSAVLEQIVGTLSERPESLLHTVSSEQPLDTAAVVDAAALARPPADLQPLDATQTVELAADLHATMLPHTLLTRRSITSTDLPEHRWIVGLIGAVERRLRRVRGLAEEEIIRHAPERRAAIALTTLLKRIERTLGRTRRLRETPLLAGLPGRSMPPTSQRLVRDRRYRPLRRVWRALRETPLLTLEVPALALPIADLPTLYEQWCALQVATALLDEPFVQQRLLREDVDRERWVLSLPTDQPLIEVERGDVHLRLRYQPRYTERPDALGIVALDGYTRIPDLVLEMITPDAPPRLLVLDAKYRRAPDGRVPQDALDDAYAYRGSLGRAGESLVAYAAILFPAQHQPEDFGTVGTVPLLPGHTDGLRTVLPEFIR